jgi:hypothetical protein
MLIHQTDNTLRQLLPQHFIVKLVAGYVMIGFVVMEILYFGVWCRPFNQYWAVPTNSSKYQLHLCIQSVLIISKINAQRLSTT